MASMGYRQRIKNYFSNNRKGIPGGFFEKIIIDVFIKLILDIFSKFVNFLIEKKGKELRHTKLEEEKNILFDYLEDSDLKYHDCFETFLHFIYYIADTDVPYYQNYMDLIRVVQKDFPEHDELSKFTHVFKSNAEPRTNAESVNKQMIREKIQKNLIKKKDRKLE